MRITYLQYKQGKKSIEGVTLVSSINRYSASKRRKCQGSSAKRTFFGTH
jgi:hypothetical protein